MIAAVGNFGKRAIVEAATAMSECRVATHEHAGTPDDPGSKWTHKDGWGAVYGSGDRLKPVREEQAISADEALIRLADAPQGLLIVHARRASVKKGAQFVHPCELNIGGSVAYFFHNGYVPEAYRLLGMEKSAWDTRELVEWLKPALESADRESQIVSRLKKLPPSTTSTNFLLVESGRLTVCNWFRDGLTPDYYTMHCLKSDQGTIVSSEVVLSIAPREEWEPVGNGRILTIPIPRRDNEFL